jgi:hypothetical protein
VSDGALSFYHDHFVRTRVSKITYGNFCHIPFDPASPDHQQRLSKTFTSVSGNRRISDSFDVILPKVGLSSFLIICCCSSCLCRTPKSRRRRSSESRISENPSRRTSSRVPLSPYGAIEVLLPLQSGKTSIHVSLCLKTINYCFNEKYIENYTKLCTIEVDLSHLPLSPRSKSGGGSFYRLDYDIVLMFGLTELKAVIAWKQNVGLCLDFIASLFIVFSGCRTTEFSEDCV